MIQQMSFDEYAMYKIINIYGWFILLHNECRMSQSDETGHE